MSRKVFGNMRGLKPSALKSLDRLFHRRIAPNEIISPELAREICTLATELRRRIGVLISREGEVEEVIVGSKTLLYLPDLGRYRLGTARLRRLRLAFSDLGSEAEAHIPADIYTDLEKLRLDMVIAVKIKGNRTRIAYAHLVPSAEADSRGSHTEEVPDLNRLEGDFSQLIQNVEQELSSLTAPHAQSGRVRAVLVGVYDKRERNVEASMAELRELARTANVEVVDTIIQRRDLDPRTLLGKGKLEQVVLHCLRLGADMMIFDAELKPSQWRVISNSTELKVIDRSMLILDIFAQHAQSSEGRLQVELAQLKYNLPRLVEFDAGLSRLTGGIGGRGPGETKLEIGRRRIRDRIADLEKRIEKIGGQRELRKERRKEHHIPLIAVLGYTNVGKSTLFNALTGSSVAVEDKLFATLDPAQRRLVIPWEMSGQEVADGTPGLTVIVSDTVGFIRNLPGELRNAFRATLEQLRDAHLLLHVVDATDLELQQRVSAVQVVLEEMGLRDVPTIMVLNKIDRVPVERSQLLACELDALPISAKAKHGMENLLRAIMRKLRNLETAQWHLGQCI